MTVSIGYAWREAVSATKELRFQTETDTCWRGLNRISVYFFRACNISFVCSPFRLHYKAQPLFFESLRSLKCIQECLHRFQSVQHNYTHLSDISWWRERIPFYLGQQLAENLSIHHSISLFLVPFVTFYDHGFYFLLELRKWSLNLQKGGRLFPCLIMVVDAKVDKQIVVVFND